MKASVRIAAAGAVCLLALACGQADERAAGDRDREVTAAIMLRFLENLRVVLPATVGEEEFREPDERPEIHLALQSLAADAAVLAAHAREGKNGTRYLRRSLERDAVEVLQQYERGRYDRAGFLLQQITENCVVCHARLPSPGDSPLAEHFVDRTALVRLRAPQRATLQIATRRFDDALGTLERYLADPEVHPALMLGPLTDYLTVSIRVKDDYVRPIPVLRRFAGRDDLWRRLRLDVEAWIAALPELHERTRGEPDLATARAILGEGMELCQLRDPRTGLVHLVAGSAILQRIVDAEPPPGPDLAEAYYLLGLTEARIGRNYWVSQAGHFLETAIRIAPEAPFAESAYATLEEEILMSYEGSAWEEIPAEEAALLAELRALIDSD